MRYKMAVIIPVCILVFLFLFPQFPDEYLAKPNFNFDRETYNDCEVMASDIKLKSGEILVVPQIIIEYKNEIVYIINVKNYYNDTRANIENDTSEAISKFKMSVTEKQKAKLETLQDDLISRLQSVSENKGIRRENINVYDIRMGKIEYQNLKRNKEKHVFWYFSPSKSKEIKEKEVRLHNRDCWIDLDAYNEELLFLNEELLDHVSECEKVIISRENTL